LVQHVEPCDSKKQNLFLFQIYPLRINRQPLLWNQLLLSFSTLSLCCTSAFVTTQFNFSSHGEAIR